MEVKDSSNLPLYRKRSTNMYITDRIFDIMDIKEQIEKNKSIKKCSPDKFLYYIVEPSLMNNKFSTNISSTPEIKPKFDLNIVLYENDNGRSTYLKDEFELVKLLGQGSYGMVIKVYDNKLKRHAALKIIKKLSNFTHEEEKNLMTFNHKNIVQYYRSFENDSYLFIVMELMEGGTLKDFIIERYLNPECEYIFNEEEAAVVMKGIINGLEYMHDHQMSHRDIKPDNIMFKEKNNLKTIKLLDMGLAVKLEKYFDKTKCGTLIYMAPEQLLGKTYTLSVDIWAAGMILFIICSGGQHPIYNSKLDTAGYTEKVTKLEKWEFTNKFPKLARNLFLRMCKFDYKLRLPSYKIILHPWISRDTNGSLPLSNMDSWRRRNELEEFKSLLAASLFLQFYKKSYFKLKEKINKDRKNSINKSKTSIHDSSKDKLKKIILPKFKTLIINDSGNNQNTTNLYNGTGNSTSRHISSNVVDKNVNFNETLRHHANSNKELPKIMNKTLSHISSEKNITGKQKVTFSAKSHKK